MKKIEQNKRLKLVVVQWVDAEEAPGGWQTAEAAAAHEAPTVYTVGFLLRRDRNNVVVASSASPIDGEFTMKSDVMCEIVIPAGMVKKIVGPDEG